MTASLLLSTLDGNPHWPPPLWLMRQAGRYLPEYRALRAEAGGFLDLVYTPELAAEVTLQPIRRFDFDAAILFSDILVVPQALGRHLHFEQGEGPRLDPLTTAREIDALDVGRTKDFLKPVFETVRRVREKLPQQKALIGFCGAPWTVATYMVAGRGKDEQEAAKKLAYGNPQLFAKLIDRLVESSVVYLNAQLEAGADCVQIFDSWAGALDSQAFDDWVVKPTSRLVEGVKKSHPRAKIIGFPRGAGVLLPRYAKLSGVDAVSLDWQQDLALCATELQIPFQGNLDPVRLLGPPERLDEIVKAIKAAVQGKPYIFNLGHGILPQTSPEAVGHLVQAVRSR